MKLKAIPSAAMHRVRRADSHRPGSVRSVRALAITGRRAAIPTDRGMNSITMSPRRRPSRRLLHSGRMVGARWMRFRICCTLSNAAVALQMRRPDPRRPRLRRARMIFSRAFAMYSELNGSRARSWRGSRAYSSPMPYTNPMTDASRSSIGKNEKKV